MLYFRRSARAELARALRARCALCAHAPLGLPRRRGRVGAAGAGLRRAPGSFAALGRDRLGVQIGQNPTPNAASVLPLPSPMAVEQQSLAPASTAEVDDPTGAVASVNTTSLSDENDFEAVAARQSIESDAKRLAESRAKYVVIEPIDLPVRPGTNEISIIEYALRLSLIHI